MMDATFYAIGDVHGMIDKLGVLHDRILAEHERSDAPTVIVHLGDYVDRGRDSRGVIEKVRRLEERAADDARLTVVSLLGNHERMMLDAIQEAVESGRRPKFEHWVGNGGGDCLQSYIRANGFPEDDWRKVIDGEHVAWLSELPTVYRVDERRLAFVHAGIDPKSFPDDEEEIHIWTRSRSFFETRTWPKRPELEGWRIVHGHTPTQDFAPFADARRINVDTGAVFGGPLSCVALAPNEPDRFLFAS